MRHMMRAEYHEPDPATAERRGDVKIWHMVRGEETRAMCGRVLDADAATQSEDAWGEPGVPFCHSCGALYLREVP